MLKFVRLASVLLLPIAMASCDPVGCLECSNPSGGSVAIGGATASRSRVGDVPVAPPYNAINPDGTEPIRVWASTAEYAEAECQSILDERSARTGRTYRVRQVVRADPRSGRPPSDGRWLWICYSDDPNDPYGLGGRDDEQN